MNVEYRDLFGLIFYIINKDSYFQQDKRNTPIMQRYKKLIKGIIAITPVRDLLNSEAQALHYSINYRLTLII